MSLLISSKIQSSKVCLNCFQELDQINCIEKDCKLGQIITKIKKIDMKRLDWLYDLLCKDDDYEICQDHFSPFQFYDPKTKSAWCEICYSEKLSVILTPNTQIDVNELQQIKKLDQIKLDQIELDQITNQQQLPEIDKSSLLNGSNNQINQQEENQLQQNPQYIELSKDINDFIERRLKQKIAKIIDQKALHENLHK